MEDFIYHRSAPNFASMRYARRALLPMSSKGYFTVYGTATAVIVVGACHGSTGQSQQWGASIYAADDPLWLNILIRD